MINGKNMYRTIVVESDGPIGLICLNRPRVLNAINREMTEEVTHALGKFSNDEGIRVIVLRGEGKAFSSGFDLSQNESPETLEQWQTWVEKDFEFIMQFWHCEKPTIAAVHGHCIAGAFELALACDITVAAEGTRFGEPEVRFGAGIVCQLLPWVVGSKIARELLLTGIDRLDTERALATGIINHIVQAENLVAEAKRIARDIASASQTAVRVTKKAINSNFEVMGINSGLRSGLDACVMIAGTDDDEHREFDSIRRKEGLRAALSWRDAKFSSRE
jgi:enoyl-CoA hydratase